MNLPVALPRTLLGARLLDRYLLRLTLLPFAIGLGVLLAGLMLERLLRIIDMLAGQGAPLGNIALLLLYLLPHYLNLAAPAALFLAALVGFRRLLDSSEYAICLAAGISPRRLLLPTLLLSILLGSSLFVLAGWIDPYARYAYRRAVYMLSASGQMLSFYPQVFVPLTDKLTLRAEQMLPGDDLRTVFMSSRDPVTQKTVYATAQTAGISRDETTGAVTLVLQKGDSVIDEHGELSRLNFETYPYTLPTPSLDSYGPRGKDARELTMLELSDSEQRATTRADAAAAAAFRTEQQARFVQALSLPFLLLLALPLALLGSANGNARHGRAYGLVAGIILLILYDKLLGFGEAAASRGKLSTLVALWGPWGLLAAGSLIMLWLAMSNGPRRTGRAALTALMPARSVGR